MTIEQLQTRLRALHAGIGHEGCLTLTFDQDPQAACYVSHWFRPERYQPERWHRIGVGTLPECLAALERYADGDRRRIGTSAAPVPAELIAAE